MSDAIWGRLNGGKENPNGVNLPSSPPEEYACSYNQNMFIFNWNLFLDSQEPKKVKLQIFTII